MRLERKADQLVDILKAAPFTPTVRVSLLEEKPVKEINYTNESPTWSDL